mgnify:FL=1
MAGVGFVRATSGMALSRDQALVELAKATRDLLLEVAATYRATITYQQLGVEVQRRAGIRAGQTPGWLMDVLAMVVHVCHRLAEPSLTALVVSATDGAVGQAFDEVRRTEGLPPFPDADARELAAAASRLECYRRYAPNVPEDAVPTLVTAAAAQRTPTLRAPRGTRPAASGQTGGVTRAATPRAPKQAPVRRRPADENRAPFVVCSSCFLQTPPGEECQNCGAPL